MGIAEDIAAHYAEGTLPELITKTILGGRKDPEAIALRVAAVELHNSGHLDILAPALSLEEGRREGYDFFLVQHFYVQIIPQLQAEVNSMMAAVRALVVAAGNDLVSGAPNGAYRDWAAQGDRAEQTLAVANPHSRDDSVFIMLALQSMAQNDVLAALERAIGFLEGSAEAAHAAAAMAIGSFDLKSEAANDRAIAALGSAIETTTNDQVRGHLASAAIDLGLKRPALNEVVLGIVAAAAASAGDETIHRMAQMLMFHAEDMAPPIVAALTLMLRRVKPENRGTLDLLDHGISALVRKGRVEEARALLEPILVAHIALHDFSLLSDSGHALLKIELDRLAHLIVAWLMSEERGLGEAARGLISKLHGEPLTFRVDFAPKGLSDAEALFLTRKAIGYLFLHPITAASILLSIIRTAPEPLAKTIGEYLFDPLLLNFSGELSEWLAKQALDDTDPATALVQGALAQLETYLDGLRAIGRVKELRPSERERMIENHRRQESMRQVHKAAEKKSVFASIFSRVVLLYGNRSISYFEGPGGERRRHEMKLGTFSHSFESPRLDTLEPFELDYRLRVYRAERIAR